MPIKEYIGTLIVIDCAKCHMTFGIPDRFQKDRRNDHATFYCPAGHDNYYPGKSEAEKLREQLDRTKKSLEIEHQLREGAQRRADAAQRSLSATKGVVTKMKRRISNGVCPCCNRHFKDLERHMHNQHPEFRGEEP